MKNSSLKIIYVLVMMAFVVNVSLADNVIKSFKIPAKSPIILTAANHTVEILKDNLTDTTEFHITINEQQSTLIMIEPPLGPPLIAENTSITVKLSPVGLEIGEKSKLKVVAFHSDGKKYFFDGVMKDSLFVVTLSNATIKKLKAAKWSKTEDGLLKTTSEPVVGTGLTDPFDVQKAAKIEEAKEIKPPSTYGFIGFQLIIFK